MTDNENIEVLEAFDPFAADLLMKQIRGIERNIASLDSLKSKLESSENTAVVSYIDRLIDYLAHLMQKQNTLLESLGHGHGSSEGNGNQDQEVNNANDRLERFFNESFERPRRYAEELLSVIRVMENETYRTIDNYETTDRLIRVILTDLTMITNAINDFYNTLSGDRFNDVFLSYIQRIFDLLKSILTAMGLAKRTGVFNSVQISQDDLNMRMGELLRGYGDYIDNDALLNRDFVQRVYGTNLARIKNYLRRFGNVISQDAQNMASQNEPSERSRRNQRENDVVDVESEEVSGRTVEENSNTANNVNSQYQPGTQINEKDSIEVFYNYLEDMNKNIDFILNNSDGERNKIAEVNTVLRKCVNDFESERIVTDNFKKLIQTYQSNNHANLNFNAGYIEELKALKKKLDMIEKYSSFKPQLFHEIIFFDSILNNLLR